MPIRHSLHMTVGNWEWDGLHVAGSSIIETGLGLDRIDSLLLYKEGGDF